MIKEASTMYTGRRCNTPDAMYRLFAPFIETKDREHLVMAGLNQKLEPTVIQTIHIGTINQSLAYPRDILRAALLSNSVSICIAHNHPSTKLAYLFVHKSLAIPLIVKISVS